jgi:NADH:ubiquinone oxidoreductase subunit F (NADH-binding)
MTATLTAPDAVTWTIGPPRLLAGLDRYAALDYANHLATHGPLPAADRPRLTALLEAIALRGRGGAGFPLARKIQATPEGAEVIVNGSESEPASFKDRTLLRRSPHLVLDGALAVATAVRARRVVVAVHDPASAAAVRHAIAERQARVHVEQTHGGFVAGEARALRRALAGGPPLPPGRRAHLAPHGTLLSNVETFAQLAVALRLGPHRFRDTGSHAEPGTTLLTLSGALARPGVVEIPIGIPLDILLTIAAAPPPQAVIIGGYHGSWHPPAAHTPLTRQTGLGAGIIAVLDHSTCALGELIRVSTWLAAQSAGQCGPCRYGLPALAHDLARGDIPAALRHATAVDGRGACHHPDGAVRFITSALHLLRDEIERHRIGGCGRPVRGQLPVPA